MDLLPTLFLSSLAVAVSFIDWLRWAGRWTPAQTWTHTWQSMMALFLLASLLMVSHLLFSHDTAGLLALSWVFGSVFILMISIGLFQVILQNQHFCCTRVWCNFIRPLETCWVWNLNSLWDLQHAESICGQTNCRQMLQTKKCTKFVTTSQWVQTRVITWHQLLVPGCSNMSAKSQLSIVTLVKIMWFDIEVEFQNLCVFERKRLSPISVTNHSRVVRCIQPN